MSPKRRNPNRKGIASPSITQGQHVQASPILAPRLVNGTLPFHLNTWAVVSVAWMREPSLPSDFSAEGRRDIYFTCCGSTATLRSMTMAVNLLGACRRHLHVDQRAGVRGAVAEGSAGKRDVGLNVAALLVDTDASLESIRRPRAQIVGATA